jgi:hypothetical protein
MLFIFTMKSSLATIPVMARQSALVARDVSLPAALIEPCYKGDRGLMAVS